MNITFDHDDAFGMTDLEAHNYVPEEGHVIGNLTAAEIAMIRYNATIDFNGHEFESWPLFRDAYYIDMHNRGIKHP